MKHKKKLNTIFITVIVLISACSTDRKVTNNKSYCNYLSSVINDTTFYEVAEVSIIDKSIYSVLDSVILLSEKCKFFDTKVKYLNSFTFSIKTKNDKPLYSISAHLSPAQAIGLTLLEARIVKNLKDIKGIFYYKNYLFAIPLSNFGKDNVSKDFPFIRKTDNILKIRAPRFLKQKMYSSYVTFNKIDSSYKIIENEICDAIIY